jgi:hypothetical protein
MSPSILHTYRTAYKLSTPSSYTHSHAELIYASSRTALRSPSAVLARQRLRDLKHQRRKSNGNAISKDTNKSKEKEKDDSTSNNTANEHILKPPSPPQPSNLSQTQSHTVESAPSPSAIHTQPSLSIVSEAHIGRQPPAALSNTVRKHFNAQQLSEAETVARFAYVVRQTRNPEHVRTEGSDGDGAGFWMGSQGREIRRGEGGEVGFRLRFRP